MATYLLTTAVRVKDSYKGAWERWEDGIKIGKFHTRESYSTREEAIRAGVADAKQLAKISRTEILVADKASIRGKVAMSANLQKEYEISE